MTALIFTLLMSGASRAESCDETCWLEHVRVRDVARTHGEAEVCRVLARPAQLKSVSAEVASEYSTLVITSFHFPEAGAVCFTLKPG